MKYQKILILIFIFIVGISCFGCTKKQSKQNSKEVNYSDALNPVVTINMDTGDKIKIELYPKVASNTVNNFINLINKGFYNGLTFHRIEVGFVIQGGDPEGTGVGGPGYKIKGEFKNNGIENNVKHTKGVISMARSNDKDSGGSQFFIMLGDATHLDGEYCAFGKVVEGIEIVDKIAAMEKGKGSKPKNPVVMKTVTVDLKGKSYLEPEKIN